MYTRHLGRTGWLVSEIGYGMWGLAGWSGSDDSSRSSRCIGRSSWAATSSTPPGAMARAIASRSSAEWSASGPDKTLYVATKIPPKNFTWPSRRGFTLDDCFPPEHIREFAEKSLANLGLPRIDLLQFHVWEDAWAADDRWQRAMADLKAEGLVQAVGISVNRWEPDNVVKTLETGLIDAVQVIYNIFDQAPRDRLLPLCEKLDIGVIARVPFDEGTLTGTLTKESTWPSNDWRSTYFVPENLNSSVDHAEALRPLVPPGMTMPELALRWILADSRVSTIIPGMRKKRHVEANTAVSDGKALPLDLLQKLKGQRWDRSPTSWSQ